MRKTASTTDTTLFDLLDHSTGCCNGPIQLDCTIIKVDSGGRNVTLYVYQGFPLDPEILVWTNVRADYITEIMRVYPDPTFIIEYIDEG